MVAGMRRPSPICARRLAPASSGGGRALGARTNNMAFDSPAKLRRSVAVAVAAPIETVVDPHLHHLDVAVPHKESVSGLEPKRSNKCPVVQPQKVILHLRRPIGQESPLDARAHQPAAIAVARGGD